MARRLLLALVLAPLGCSSDDTAHGGPPPTTQSCADGFSATDAGCEPIEPASPCPTGTMATFGLAECQPVGWTDCPAGFEPDAGGWGCHEIVADGVCPAGTMAKLGEAACVPVGWTDPCPAGFEADPSGWGCRGVLPPDPCTGATKATLGSTSCQPVGDCAAAFPPAGATLFVDDDFSGPQIDATHFATIGAALAAAVDGDVIAIDAGSYVEGLVVGKSVSLVGRCAAQTVVSSVAGAVAGVRITKDIDVTLHGLTFTGHKAGMGALNGATVTVDQCVFDANSEIGVFAADDGTVVTVNGSVVRGTLPGVSGDGFGADAEGGGKVVLTDTELADNQLAGVFALAGGILSLDRCVVQRTKPDGGGHFGHGLHAQDDASQASVVHSVFADNTTLGVYGTGAGVAITVEGSEVRGTKPDNWGQYGVGVQADTGASATVTSSAVVANHFIGVFGAHPDSHVSLTRVVVRDTQALPKGNGGRGASLQETATMSLVETALVGNLEYGIVGGGAGTTMTLHDSLVTGTRRGDEGDYGWGMSVIEGATATLVRTTLDDNEEYGVAVAHLGAFVDAKNILVRGTDRSPFSVADDQHYRVQGIGVQENAKLVLSDSAIVQNREIGLYVYGTDDQGLPPIVEAEGVVVRGTLPDSDDGPGNAAGALVGPGGRLTLRGGGFYDNSTTGLVVQDAAGTAALDHVVFAGTQLNNEGMFGRAIAAQTGGEATIDHCALVGNREIALFVDGAKVALTDTLIAGTLADGVGEAGRAIGVQFGSSLDAARLTIEASREVAVHVIGPDASANISDALVGATVVQEATSSFGHGFVVDHGTLAITRSRVHDSAGIGLVFIGATGSVTATKIDHNLVGIHAQGGSSLVSSDEPGVAGAVYVASDTRFVDNVTRVGSGEVPVPQAEGVLPAQ